MDTTNAVPNPGSDEAILRGCICPVIDNHYGRGIPLSGGITFWITGGCPVHYPPQPHTKDKTDE